MHAQSDSQVVVITDKADAHLAYVQPHIKKHLHVIDPQMLLEDTLLSYELCGDKMRITYAGNCLDQVVGVWYRKPRTIVESQVPVKPDFKGYSGATLQRHVMMLHSAFQDALWLSDYYAIERATNKSLQLEVAAGLGFAVPATTITSDPAVAQQFIEHHHRTIVKPLASNAMPVINGIQKAFFATLVDRNNLPDLSQLHLAPAIFQQAINPLLELRVTVVGDKVFAAAIHITHNDSSTSVRDWRASHFDENTHIETYHLPSVIEKLCVKLVKKLGLQFGAIDLIMDPKGRIWFIENNANGQWAFIEKHTGQPIGKAIADLLASRA